MVYLVVFLTLLLEIAVLIKNIHYGPLVILAIYCLVPINFGINVGIRLNILTLCIGCFIFFCLRYIKRKSFDSSFKKVLCIYAGYVLVSSFIAHSFSPFFYEYPRNTFAFLANFFLVGFFLNYIPFKTQLIKNVCDVLFGLSIIIGFYGIFTYVISFNPYIAYVNIATDSLDMSNAFLEEQRGFIQGRVSSTFIHPLLLGQVCTVFFSFMLFMDYSRVRKIITLCLYGLMIVLCGSRSALIPLIIMCTISLFIRKRKNIIRNAFLALVAAVIGFHFIPEEHQETAKGFFFFWDDSYAKESKIQGSSLAMRLDQLESGFEIIKDNPLFGLGQGYVSQHSEKHPQMLGFESFVFQFLVDGGIVGLLIYCLFLLLLYRNLLKKCKKRKDYGIVHSLCLGYYLNLLFTGIFAGTFVVFIIIYYYVDQILVNNMIQKRTIVNILGNRNE